MSPTAARVVASRQSETARRPLRVAVVAAIAAALAGCATGPAFTGLEPAPADGSQIYVYRPMVVAGGGVTHKLTVDGRADSLSLPNASWLRILVAPGRHSLSIRDYFNTMNCGGLQLDLGAGQTAFVVNVVKTTQGVGHLYVSCAIAPRASEDAVKEMAGLRGAQ